MHKHTQIQDRSFESFNNSLPVQNNPNIRGVWGETLIYRSTLTQHTCPIVTPSYKSLQWHVLNRRRFEWQLSESGGFKKATTGDKFILVTDASFLNPVNQQTVNPADHTPKHSLTQTHNHTAGVRQFILKQSYIKNDIILLNIRVFNIFKVWFNLWPLSLNFT